MICVFETVGLMAKRKQAIPDRDKKIDFLLTDLTARRIAKAEKKSDITSRPTLAKAMDLTSHSNFYNSDGTLSDTVENHIRRIYRIEIDSECWGEFAAGSFEDFVDEYRKLHPQVNSASHKNVHPEMSEVALEVDRAAQIRRETHPLASLVLFTQQPGPGQPWPLSFELCCNPDKDEFDHVAVKRGHLVIEVKSAELDAQSRPGFAGPEIYLGSKGPVSFSWEGPRKNSYVWEVVADGEYIGNVATPSELAFCDVCDLEPGGAIAARFEIVLKDMTHLPDQGERPGDRQLPIVKLGVEGLGEAKEWIVRRIKEIALSDEGGRVLLAEHIIPFRKRGVSGGENEPV